MFIRRLLAATLAVACLSGGAPGAWAQAPSAEAATPAYAPPAQEAADAARLQQILAAMQQSGPAALRPYLRELRQIAGRAPAHYPLVEIQGPYTIVRSDEIPAHLALSLTMQAVAERRQTAVVPAFNTYGYARIMLASYAVETRDYPGAIRELDAGLAMQPDNGFMVSEKAAALEAMRRPAEALAVIAPWLEAHPLSGAFERALLLRGKGYALAELNRLDEAEAAYRESLTMQPGHKGAENELRYIAERRAGRGVTAPVQMITSDKAQTTAPTATQ